MQDFLKDQDLFGHPVELNFNKRGSQHNTVLGGIVSIVVKALMVAYVGLLFNRMLIYGDDSFNSTSTLMNHDYEEGLSF